MIPQATLEDQLFPKATRRPGRGVVKQVTNLMLRGDHHQKVKMLFHMFFYDPKLLRAVQDAVLLDGDTRRWTVAWQRRRMAAMGAAATRTARRRGRAVMFVNVRRSA